MDRLLLIDGHNLLFQMFFGMPSRIIGKEGKPIHGVLGFVGALNKIIKMVNPTHILVLFDGEHGNFRSEISGDYKANRTDFSTVSEEDNPFSQLGYIKDALKEMKIPFYEEDEYEVDDVIASYVNRYQSCEIVISSFDSDYFQLIDERVSVLRYRGKQTTVCNGAYVVEKFGISPKLYADFKSLTGDSADNVKGLKNVGAKTAAQLINKFGNIEAIISHAEQIKSERLRNTISDGRERLKNNLALIQLKDVGKIPYKFDELAYFNGGQTTHSVLVEVGLLQ